MRVPLENYRRLTQLRNQAKRAYGTKNYMRARQELNAFAKNKIRQNPWFLIWVEENENKAARRIQKRFLNKRALRVFSALRSLPRNVQTIIASRVLRRRSAH